MKTILITGLSGAGRSTALRILEDQGFMALDNIPLSFVSDVLEKKAKTPFVLGIDCRNLDFCNQTFCQNLIRIMEKHEDVLQSLFLTCDEETLLRRYTESRRRHPLRLSSLKDCIEQERDLLKPLQLRCDQVIDTSSISRAVFHQRIQDLFLKTHTTDLKIQILSFSYRIGLPMDADFIFDMRFLNNPYYHQALKHKSGLDFDVQDFIKQDPLFEGYKRSLEVIFENSLKGFLKNGRSYVTIAFGCTGGQHRSVFMAQEIKKWFENSFDFPVTCSHRELENL
ncbi:MAG TPA: RNase adapter RapZ [Alphaproteobacteria bacterium]|nr:RNase adapter RapZ [Alphaproteobacteria bacterium]